METNIKTLLRKLAYWPGVVIVGLLIGFSVQFVRAWTEPTANPPGGNIDAPINISGNAQTKIGGLILNCGTGANCASNGSSADNGLVIPNGKVGIGTTSPGATLDVYASTPSIRIQGATAPQLKFLETGSGYNESMRLMRNGDVLSLTYGENGGEEALSVKSNGDVGIGTTSPAKKLDVNGNLRVYDTIDTPSGALYLNPASRATYVNAGGGNNLLYVYGYDTDSNTYTTISGNNITLRRSGSDSIVLRDVGDSYLNGGNVGIGTTAPTALLNVGGNRNAFRAGIMSSVNALTIGSSGGNYAGIGYNTTFTGTDNQWQYNGSDTASLIDFYNGGFKFWGSPTSGSAGATTNMSTLMFIKNNGNVGIGGVDPVYSFDVGGPGVPTVNIRNANGQLYVNNIAPNTGADIYVAANLGIGKVNSGYRVDVNGDVNISGTYRVNGTPISTGGASTLSAGNVSSGQFGSNTGGGNFSFPANVGIGTASPAYKLDVYDSGTSVFGNSAGSSAFIVRTGASSYIDFQPGGTTSRMRMNTDGNVGIGTTNALRKLAIGTTSDASNEISILTSTTGFGSLLFGDGTTGSDVYRGYVQYQNNGDYMLFGTAATEKMRIDSSGNVGIGTGSPGQKLSVTGTVESTSGGFKFPDGTTQTTAASGGARFQIFTSSGTWTRPSGVNTVLVTICGGGGGGGGGNTTYDGSGGGGGGAGACLLSWPYNVSGNVNVDIGGGGTGGGPGANGNSGGSSVFGGTLSAAGGGGGSRAPGGGSGGNGGYSGTEAVGGVGGASDGPPATGGSGSSGGGAGGGGGAVYSAGCPNLCNKGAGGGGFSSGNSPVSQGVGGLGGKAGGMIGVGGAGGSGGPYGSSGGGGGGGYGGAGGVGGYGSGSGSAGIGYGAGGGGGGGIAGSAGSGGAGKSGIIIVEW